VKLAARDTPAYFARPDPDRAGILIYGPDQMRVALRRQELIAALVGPSGEAEMRLSRFAAGDLRGEPSALGDAMRERGFFPGPRVVFLDNATDTTAQAVEIALSDWQKGDAQLVVTAGQLNARSRLRKLFEDHRNTYAVAIYADPPSRAEIETRLASAGLRDIPQPAMAEITGLAATLDPGDFAQTIEKLALYKLGDSGPLSPADIAAIAPASTEAELDDLIAAVAEARASEISPLMRRLQSQGTQPVGIVIGMTRHFRQLHAAASHPDGASEGIARLRPPVFGPRRDRMLRQAQTWGMHRLEEALAVLLDTDLALRSSSPPPAFALVERALIRLSYRGRG
jgi:DNA polymerase-3 subunit delta